MTHNRRVLIVDDQRAIHDDFRKLLEAAPASAAAALEQTILGESPLASVDYEIESAYQGEAGLEAVRHARASGRPFALAIVDARMPPGWDGLLTVEKIFEADAEIQGVICTAYSDTRWHELQRRFGVSDRLIILKKPFDPAEVCQLVCAMTEKWNLALKRRQAMDALIAARETARESEERFRLIANTAPVMIWMSDVDKQVSYVNQRWLDFTGWPPNEAPGHRWISLIHPDDVERCGDVYVKAFDQRQPFEVEHRLRRHDGEDRWTVTVGVPRYGADRAFVGYVGTAVDVTDRKLVEAALLESHAALGERTVELERRTTQLSQMASDLTLAEQHAREELAQTLHDGLQQVLTVAVMKLDSHIMRMAQRGTVADELVQAKTHLDEAIAAARSLSVELFPPVLQTSGLPIALGWLADWARSRYALEVKVSADPRADSGRKDIRTLLFGSVRELLFNVVKHAHVDRVTVDLALDPNNTLCITVTDEGLGFDPLELDERAKVNQVGWGLFSIRERLTLLGGRFDVESAPGRGATFRLIAPRDVAHRPVGAESPSSPAAIALPARHAARSASSYPLRILIADDHAALRKTFGELLQARPEFQVVGEAVNGLEAIAQAHACRPDVVLMDISMPEMDGVEATRRIRAELPFIQILGFSTYPRMGPHAIELAGAEGFFTKGTDTARLINHLLGKHASLRSDHFGQST
jgi:PAS domain S-box-containing protein